MANPAAFTLDAATILSFLALIPAIWLYTAYMARTRFPTLRGASILLLTAHPDDEAMFFSPAVQALARPENGNHVKILCLSTGDAAGLGAVRRGELRASAVRLGLRSEADALCLDDPKLQDGPHAWPEEHIASLLLQTFAPGAATTPASAAPRATIDALLTFDRRGVSGHANHTSCRAAALAFHAKLMERHAGWASPVAIYTLTSVNVLRKYSGMLDTLLSVVWAMLRLILRKDSEKRGWSGGAQGQGQGSERARAQEEKDKTLARDMPSWLLFIAGLDEWWKGLGAMVKGHRSQMVWFRWGWISIGRYMIINELRRIR